MDDEEDRDHDWMEIVTLDDEHDDLLIIEKIHDPIQDDEHDDLLILMGLEIK